MARKKNERITCFIIKAWLMLAIIMQWCGETNTNPETSPLQPPETISPMYYNISFNTHLEKCRKALHDPCHFEGEVTIALRVNKTTQDIVLHSSHQLKIANASIRAIADPYPKPIVTTEAYNASTTAMMDDDAEPIYDDIEVDWLRIIVNDKNRLNNQHHNSQNHPIENSVGRSRAAFPLRDSEEESSLVTPRRLATDNDRIQETGSSPFTTATLQKIQNSNSKPVKGNSYTTSKPSVSVTPSISTTPPFSTDLPENYEGPTIAVTVGGYSNESETVHLKTAEPIEPGFYKLRMEYTGTHGTDGLGFYMASNKYGKNESFLLATRFEPNLARRAFPCFDEPRFKATFQITVNISKELVTEGYLVLSNTPRNISHNSNGTLEPHKELQQQKTNNKTSRDNNIQNTRDDREVFKFEPTPMPMSSFSVAIVLTDYAGSRKKHFIMKEERKKIMRTWTQKNIQHSAKFSENYGPMLVQLLESLYNITFPFPKIDQILFPNFTIGGMNNWGMIAYSDETIFTNPSESINSHFGVIAAILQGISGQLFGNMVTLESWPDAWINVAFASFHEAQLGKMSFKSNKLKTDPFDSHGRFVTVNIQAMAFVADGFNDSHPLRTPDLPAQAIINSRFNAITYGKGGGFIRMIKSFMGDEMFQQAVKSYLLTNATASPETLFHSFNISYDNYDDPEKPMLPDTDFHTTFADWYLVPGYPLVKVVQENDRKLTVTQERFLYINQQPETANQSAWNIPLSYTTDREKGFGGIRPFKFLRKGKNKVTLRLLRRDPKWFILNNMASGMYRVLYEKKNWDALRDQMIDRKMFKHIHRFNRAQLMDDYLTFSLMEMDKPYVEFVQALNYTKYLMHERNFLPWRPFSRNMRLVLEMLNRPKTGDPELFQAVKKFVKGILKERMRRMKKEKTTEIKRLVMKQELRQLKEFLKSVGTKHRSGKNMVFFEHEHGLIKYENQGKHMEMLTGRGIIAQKADILKYIKRFCKRWCKK